MRLWRALGSGDPQGTSLPEPNFGDTDILKGFDIGPALDDFIKKLPQAKEKLGEFKDAAHDAFGELAHQIKGVLLGFQSVGDAIRNLVSRLADMALDWAFKALGTAIGVPGFASGTSFAPGGLALVGERGPELVNLPRGSQVHTTSETQRMLGGGQPVHFHFPGVTTERQAREAGAQAALRFRQLMNGPVRA